MIRINIKFVIYFLCSFLGFYFIGGIMFNIIYYLFLITFLISSIHIFIQYKNLSVMLDYKDGDYFVGDTIVLNFTLNNKISILMSYLNLDSKYFNMAIYLMPFTNESFKQEVKLIKRGLYKVEDFNICIRDMFNIYTVKKKIEIDEPIKVYPKIKDLSYRMKVINGYTEYLEEVEKIDSILDSEQYSIRSIRKYVPGDSLNKIHWKLSAKRNSLLVKNFEQHNENRINVFISLDEMNSYKYEDYDEEFISFTVSILKYLIIKEFNIKIFINDIEKTFMNIKNQGDFKKVLEYFITNKFYTGDKSYEFINQGLYGDSNTLFICLMDDEKSEENNLYGSNVNVINLKHIIKGAQYEFE